MKQFIVNRHTTPATPTLEEVPNEKIRVFKNEATIDAALSSLDENEIVATEDGAESSTRIGNPLGTILAIHSNAVPYGYLPCNGVAFDEHQYPALYALLGDNHTPYSYDKSRLGDWESITLNPSGTTMSYDGFIKFMCNSGPSTLMFFYINGVEEASIGYEASTNRQFIFPVKKGDVITYSVTNTSIYSVRACFYTHFNVIKATSGLEETQQDYVLQSLLEADSYSTEEVATGKKWIDGKPIYRKCFYSATNWSSGTVIGTISNIDMVTEIRDLCRTGNTYMQNYGADAAGTTQRTDVNVVTGDVTVYRSLGFANSYPSTVIVEYTKTN